MIFGLLLMSFPFRRAQLASSGSHVQQKSNGKFSSQRKTLKPSAFRGVIFDVKPDPALELFTGLVGIAFVIVSIVGVYKFFALCANVGAIRQMMRDREIREESERISRVRSGQ